MGREPETAWLDTIITGNDNDWLATLEQNRILQRKTEGRQK